MPVDEIPVSHRYGFGAFSDASAQADGLLKGEVEWPCVQPVQYQLIDPSVWLFRKVVASRAVVAPGLFPGDGSGFEFFNDQVGDDLINVGV